ncbi:MAG TPA: DUF1559 domain-containing protein [Pirellulaceae bacterium]|nr:DUF1559 domain-containing protein [Pirellulaceae bacterium]
MKLIFPDGIVALLALAALMIGFGFVMAVAAVIRRNRLVDALIVVALVGITISLLLPAVHFGPYIGRRRPSCRDNLRQIAAAMTAYEIRYESLPPPYIADAQGRPMHSWRVLILPELGEQELYDQYHFDEPWDGPNNRQLHDRIVDVYRCPQDHPNRWNTAARQTSYVVIAGPGTIFPGGRKKMSVAQIANGDGCSNTLLVVEIHDSGIHWMEPRDLDLATMDFQINGKRAASISSNHEGGVMVAMVDGFVRYLDERTPPNVVRQLITYKDRQPLPENLGVPQD